MSHVRATPDHQLNLRLTTFRREPLTMVRLGTCAFSCVCVVAAWVVCVLPPRRPPRLSGSGQIACATRTRPHPDLDLAWADGRTTRFGHSRVRAAQRLIGIVVTTTTPREGSDTATPFERSTPLSVRLTTGKPSASAGRSSLK